MTGLSCNLQCLHVPEDWTALPLSLLTNHWKLIILGLRFVFQWCTDALIVSVTKFSRSWLGLHAIGCLCLCHLHINYLWFIGFLLWCFLHFLTFFFAQRKFSKDFFLSQTLLFIWLISNWILCWIIHGVIILITTTTTSLCDYSLNFTPLSSTTTTYTCITGVLLTKLHSTGFHARLLHCRECLGTCKLK